MRIYRVLISGRLRGANTSYVDLLELMAEHANTNHYVLIYNKGGVDRRTHKYNIYLPLYERRENIMRLLEAVDPSLCPDFINWLSHIDYVCTDEWRMNSEHFYWNAIVEWSDKMARDNRMQDLQLASIPHITPTELKNLIISGDINDSREIYTRVDVNF